MYPPCHKGYQPLQPMATDFILLSTVSPLYPFARSSPAALRHKRGIRSLVIALLFAIPAVVPLWGQSAPAEPSKVWHGKEEQGLERELASRRGIAYSIDPQKKYTLAELIDLAQEHNPETRYAWQTAKARAAALGVARSALFPTVAAVVLGATVRQAALINESFHRQTIALFEPTLHVEYLIFDVGGRGGAIDVAKAGVLAANLAFNDTHRKLIFQVASSYYRLLNAKGQREAAEISLKNAQTVEEDADSRLKNGLATRPDLLEATAARTQADFDLQAAVGNEDIARGDLATVLGLSPATAFELQEINDLTTPIAMTDSVDKEIDRAFAQRPELMQEMARLRAAEGVLRQARSTYFPSISLTSDVGRAWAYGQQDLYPEIYARGKTWNAGLQLKWTIFDGTRREHEIAEGNAEKRAAEANIDGLRDQIENETWAAYTSMKTALRQQQSAASLLAASTESYESARQAYGYGVRSLLDVVSAQKVLAQARSEDVSARTQLLLQVANLAFRTGDLIQAQARKVGP